MLRVFLVIPGGCSPERELLCDVERDRGLAHRWTSREDHHFFGLEPCKEPIEIVKSGREPGDGLPVGFLDPDHLLHQEFFE